MSQKTRPFVLTIVFSFGFLLGIGVLLCIYAEVEFPDKFYEVKLFDVLQMLVTVLLAVCIAVFIDKKLSFTEKRREMVNSIIDQLHEKIVQIYDDGSSYIEGKKSDRLLEGRINRGLKHASSLMAVLCDADKHADKRLLEGRDIPIISNFFHFKSCLTDTPFGQQFPRYSPEAIAGFAKAYDILTQSLMVSKIRLYV